MKAKGDYQSTLVTDPTRATSTKQTEDEWYWNESDKEPNELDELDKQQELAEEALTIKKPPAPSILRNDDVNIINAKRA